MEDEVVRFSHSGARYVIGYGPDFFGIWDRTAPDAPVERFPRTDEGWQEAWLRFASMERSWVEVAAGEPSGLRPALATPLSRLAARIIDGLILAGILTALVAAGGIRVERLSTDDIPTALLGAALLVSFLYETTFIGLRGQTPGKMLSRVRVARLEDGAPPGLGRAFVRWGIPVLCSIVPFGALIAYLWLLWDRRRQGLHDKAARTVVVRSARSAATSLQQGSP